MTIPGFNPKADAEIQSLRAECRRPNNLDALIVREAIAASEARGTARGPHAFLRLQIATSYARRRQRSAA